MKILRIVIIVIAGVVVIGVTALARHGLFATVTISERNLGPHLLVYQKHIGDYKQVGAVMDELYNDLKDNYAIETTRGFGLYYDNPREVNAAELRSVVGCIVEGMAVDDLANVGSKYGVKEFPASESVVAEFPFKGTISIMLGLLKVYPKLSKYLAAHNFVNTPIMEIYDRPNEQIQYMASPNVGAEVFQAFLE